MIQFTEDRPKIAKFLGSSVQKFAQEFPGSKVCIFGVYCCPWSGWISTNFESAAHMEQHLAGWRASEPDFIESDEWGEYNDNCPDFEHVEYSLLELEHWQAEYEAGGPFQVRKDGKTQRFSENDEDINRFFFTELLPIVQEVNFTPLIKTEVFRIGVQMLDSDYLKFWKV